MIFFLLLVVLCLPIGSLAATEPFATTTFLAYEFDVNSTLNNTVARFTQALANAAEVPQDCFALDVMLSIVLAHMADCPNSTATAEKLLQQGSAVFDDLPTLHLVSVQLVDGSRKPVWTAAVPSPFNSRVGDPIPPAILLIWFGTCVSLVTVMQFVYFVRFRRSELYRTLVANKIPLSASL